jgi:hypothetical protein
MNQITETIFKAPSAVRFPAVDLSTWLGDGETITAQSVTSNDDTLLVDQASNTDGVVAYRVRGGTVETDPIVTLEVTTSAGRVEPFFFQYRIRKPG